ncbi:restriction endonuclease subunit S [Mesorhizobium sp. M1163]|uniref:restriction endonuclease subunit S n=1 Tax=Mesorhizobium sp. M1163 TaxID=2957065 RepID=UPI003336BF17
MMEAWETKPLGQIVALQRGFDLPVQSRSDGAIAVIGSNGLVGFHNSVPTDVPIPGLMVGRSGSVGEITFWDTEYWPLNTVLYVKDFHGNDPLFLSFWLRLFPFKQYSEGVSVPTLNRNSINDVQFLLPKPDDQRKISIALTAIEVSIRLQSEILLKSRELKRAAMRELFTRGLRGEVQVETEFGLVPETWQTKALDDCATVQTGVTKGRKLTDAEMVCVPYLRVANVQDGHLDLSEMKEIRIRRSEVDRYRLQAGDVVLTEGGDFDKLGRGFIWRGELDLCIHQNHVFAVRPDRTRLLPEFFAYLAQSAYGKAYFLKVAHKTTNLASINSTKLKAFPVLIPPTLDEQREIVEILDTIDRKIDLHKRKHTVLEDLFRALLHKLMTGEIRVADLDLSSLARGPTEEAAA